MKKTGWVVIVCLVTTWIGSTAMAEGLSVEREQEIIRLALSAYDPGNPLLAGTEIEDIRKCGTSLQIELRSLWTQLSAETQTLLKPYAFRPVLPLVYDVPPGNHFRIHYDTVSTNTNSVDMSRGVDTDGIPIYVKTCAEILRTVWQKEIVDLGYREPVEDDFYTGGGTPALDIYISAMSSYILGQTTPDSIFYSPVRNNIVATAYIEIDNDYRNMGYPTDQWIDVMEVTLAHEFFHAVQFGIDYSEMAEESDLIQDDRWWMEMTATWMEDVVYDNVNDYYNYLEYFLGHPNWALTTFGQTGHRAYYPYGACLWPRYLAERFGDQIIHDIWTECGQHPYFNTIQAWIDQISANGSSLQEELGRFRLWCYLSGDRYRPGTFEEGAAYPTFDELQFVTSHGEYPVEDSVRLTVAPEYMGVAYLRFDRPALGQTTDFKVQISAGELDLWTVTGAGYGEYVEPVLHTIEDIRIPLVVPDWQLYDDIMVMVMPYSDDYGRDQDLPGQKFYYIVSDTLEPIVGNVIHTVYPNPFDPQNNDLVVKVYREDKEETEVFFYTASGELVRGGRSEPEYYRREGAGKHPEYFRWDGLNSAGEKVASGVYLCLVRLGNRQSIQKVAVFRP